MPAADRGATPGKLQTPKDRSRRRVTSALWRVPLADCDGDEIMIDFLYFQHAADLPFGHVKAALLSEECPSGGEGCAPGLMILPGEGVPFLGSCGRAAYEDNQGQE